MTVAIESFNFVPVRLAEVLEAPAFEGMVHVIAFVIGLVVVVPMIIVDVRQVVDASAFPAILLRRGGARLTMLGRIRDASVIGARRIRSVVASLLFASLFVRAAVLGALCKGWERQQ